MPRRVVHTVVARAPPSHDESALLPPLTADLTQLVLCHLKVHELCWLKGVSNAVANACRRALRNEEVEDRDKKEHDQVYRALKHCDLAFPLKLFYGTYMEETFRARDPPATVLVLHSMELEVYDATGKRVTDLDVLRQWIWENEETSSALLQDVVCSEMCVEVLGVGMFYSAYALMHQLGMPEGGDEMWKTGCPVVELLSRLYPFLRFGGETMLFKADHNLPGTHDYFTSTLLALFATGRIVACDAPTTLQRSPQSATA